ncbi:MAG: virulence RhuM family protein [Anaerolineae bacterium]|nr:virulence RhuM family protein [Anaerolineae bacterium]
MTDGELILYTTEDGQAHIRLRAEDGTVWLSQAELAELFQSTKQNISLHIKNVLSEGELTEAVVKESLTTAADGKNYRTKHYNLDMILAVGYRVRSARGTQFRQWATTHLREYLIKGFVLDDARLKEPGGWDYFDELLERIRDIRASEKRFYQKVRDIYTTAVDYDPGSEQAQLFFKVVQNKMLWAVTGRTAAELIADRSNPALPNMGLTAFKGTRVRQADVTVAKNYLGQREINELNRIVVMYLDFAEDMAERRRMMTMADWTERLDAFLTFNERDVLTHAGKLRADVAARLAKGRYEEFDANRKEAERLAADTEDMKVLEAMGQEVERAKRRGGSGASK